MPLVKGHVSPHSVRSGNKKTVLPLSDARVSDVPFWLTNCAWSAAALTGVLVATPTALFGWGVAADAATAALIESIATTPRAATAVRTRYDDDMWLHSVNENNSSTRS